MIQTLIDFVTSKWGAILIACFWVALLIYGFTKPADDSYLDKP